jgi:hypothetical protein
MKRWLWLVLPWSVSCGDPDNLLRGSIDELFDLEFDRVEVRIQENDLLIEYLKDLTGGTQKSAKVVVDTEELDIGPNTVISEELFLERVQISRVATTGGDFPPLVSGKIRFDAFSLEAGGTNRGEWDGVFDNGRTLRGIYTDNNSELVDVN